jgi:hypothetical protein
VAYVLTLRVLGADRYPWQLLLFVASVMLLPGLLVTDRDIQRRREIGRLRGLLPRATPLLVVMPIVLLGLFLVRSGILIDDRARRFVEITVLSSLAGMIIRSRRHDRLLPPLPSRPMLFADR